MLLPSLKRSFLLLYRKVLPEWPNMYIQLQWGSQKPELRPTQSMLETLIPLCKAVLCEMPPDSCILPAFVTACTKDDQWHQNTQITHILRAQCKAWWAKGKLHTNFSGSWVLRTVGQQICLIKLIWTWPVRKKIHQQASNPAKSLCHILLSLLWSSKSTVVKNNTTLIILFSPPKL